MRGYRSASATGPAGQYDSWLPSHQRQQPAPWRRDHPDFGVFSIKPVAAVQGTTIVGPNIHHGAAVPGSMVDQQARSEQQAQRHRRTYYNVFNMAALDQARPALEEQEGQQQQQRKDPFDMTRLLHTPVMQHFDQELARIERAYGDAFFGTGDTAELSGASKRVTGDMIVQNIQKQLDSFGLVREEHQRQFHDMFIESCLPKIYYREWSNNYERIMRRFGLTKLQQESLIVCPRRYGKTYSVGMFCAAYLMNVPNCEIALFSTGKRTAGKLMALILSFLDMIPGFRDKIETKNQELLVLDFGVGDKRKLNCYPGSVGVPLLSSSLFSLFFFFLFVGWLVGWLAWLVWHGVASWRSIDEQVHGPCPPTFSLPPSLLAPPFILSAFLCKQMSHIDPNNYTDNDYRLYHVAVYPTKGRWPYGKHGGYDTYSEAVVLAPSEEVARLIHPGGMPLGSRIQRKNGADWPLLADKDLIHVAEIGVPNNNTLVAMKLEFSTQEPLARLFKESKLPQASIVVASYHAG